MNTKVVLDRILADISAAKAGDTTAHSSYVSGLFEDNAEKETVASNAVLSRVLNDIQSAKPGDTTAHSSYVSGVFEE